MSNFNQLISDLSSLTVDELGRLATDLSELFGVEIPKESSGFAPATIPVVSAKTQTEFSVELSSFGTRKVEVIKMVRELMGLSLMDAKNMVEGAPKILKEGLEESAADEIQRKLESVGATAKVI